MIAAGATVVNIPDTVGYALPEEFGHLVAYVREHTKGIEKAVPVGALPTMTLVLRSQTPWPPRPREPTSSNAPSTALASGRAMLPSRKSR